VNKNDLSKAVYEAHGGMSYSDSQKTVDLMFDIIKKKLSQSDKVLLSGFGCFRVVKRKDKKGVNPRTGEPVMIAGRNSVKFKPSKYLKSI
jgi:nucleoid DNA-binding protein